MIKMCKNVNFLFWTLKHIIIDVLCKCIITYLVFNEVNNNFEFVKSKIITE